MRQLLKFMLILASISLAFAIDFKSLMVAGNKQYEQGNYKQAAREYERILAADGNSPILHYNLGCAYFHLKSYGKAVLHFEKARQLSPRDEDIQHNLEFTKLFLKDRFELPEPMPLVKWASTAWRSLSLVELRRVELSLFILTVLGLITYRLLRDRQSGNNILTLVIISGLLFVLSAGWLWERSRTDEGRMAVLLVNEAAISSAPVPGSSTLFVIHEGTEGEILNTTDTWYEIRLPDGKTGWIPHEAVGVF